MATMTLAQAARQMEESGKQIKVGDFESFDSFMFYFNTHYKPLLENLRNEWHNASGAQRFLAGDILSAFSEEGD